MSINGFDEWLETPQGQYVLQWEQAQYDLLVADIFGFKAVQLGLPQHDFLRANRMPFRFHCDGKLPARAGLIAKPHFLPFANASIDLVILPHVLEFDAAPHQILREVERVLVPEGQVVVTGFNPFSLWGVRRKFTRKKFIPNPTGAPSSNTTGTPSPNATGSPPWGGQYLSILRLKDWFALLGFETHAGSFGCYAPPVSHGLQRWRFMELAGNRWWPYAGATYIIQAIKRVHGMRLIIPVRHDLKALAKAFATVAQNTRAESNERKA
ncbi:MAG: methyltransferase domain-containing protein [Proteobacteria bacterium]|nr:methyltransferase domain-containing protein [Pseudomonadota bacterium]